MKVFGPSLKIKETHTYLTPSVPELLDLADSVSKSLIMCPHLLLGRNQELYFKLYSAVPGENPLEVLAGLCKKIMFCLWSSVCQSCSQSQEIQNAVPSVGFKQMLGSQCQ